MSSLWKKQDPEQQDKRKALEGLVKKVKEQLQLWRLAAEKANRRLGGDI